MPVISGINKNMNGSAPTDHKCLQKTKIPPTVAAKRNHFICLCFFVTERGAWTPSQFKEHLANHCRFTQFQDLTASIDCNFHLQATLLGTYFAFRAVLGICVPVLETFLRYFGAYLPDRVAQLLHIYDVILHFHRILKVWCKTPRLKEFNT